MVPFWVPIIIRGLIRGVIEGTQKGTIILTIPQVKYRDVEQGFKIRHDGSAQDYRTEIARTFGLASIDTLTLRDADGDVVVPSYGNVANDRTYTVHANPAP